jgi:hypothetical protein
VNVAPSVSAEAVFADCLDCPSTVFSVVVDEAAARGWFEEHRRSDAERARHAHLRVTRQTHIRYAEPTGVPPR